MPNALCPQTLQKWEKNKNTDKDDTYNNDNDDKDDKKYWQKKH